jgi:hypothetical protein
VDLWKSTNSFSRCSVEQAPDRRRDGRELKSPATHASVAVERTLQCVTIAVPIIVLASLSWAKWPDAVIDFGQQLYIAWRLACGDVLHRDVAYHHGPLAANVNALLFQACGTGLWILIAANAVVAGVIFAAIHHLLRKGTSAWAATFTTAFGICVFAFAQYVGVGNYNYLTPYVHDSTHGLMWALIMLVLFERQWSVISTATGSHGVFGSRTLTTLAGVALGLCFLTKAEIFLAATGVAATFMGLEMVRCQHLRIQFNRCGVMLTSGFMLPPAIAFTVYLWYLPFSAAALATAGPWPAVLRGTASANIFYSDGMGLDKPLENSLRMLVCALSWLAVWGLAVGAGIVFREAKVRSLTAVGLGVVSALLTFAAPIHWIDAARGIPLLLVGLLAVEMRTLLSRFKALGIWDPTLGVRALCCLFALLLTLKIILNVRVYHYGFILAMPGVLVATASALGRPLSGKVIPSAPSIVTRAVILGILLTCAIRHVQASQRIWALKVHSVGEGMDWFLAGPEGVVVEEARLATPSILAPDEDLAVMPDGTMLAYLIRRQMGIPFIYFMPNDLAIYGEDKVIQSLDRSAPQAVAIVHKDTSEFGARFFGQDYARKIATFIITRYRARLCVGAPPMKNDGFGILLLTRRETVGDPKSSVGNPE